MRELGLLPSAKVAEGHRPPAEGLVGQAGPAVRRAVADVELVVQVGEVLLHRRLAHHQLGGDLPDRRRLGEEVTVEQRPAQHASTSCSRAVSAGLSASDSVTERPTSVELRNSSRVRPTRTSSPWRSRCWAQIRSPFRKVPFEEPRSVTHQPAGEPLEHGVQAAHGRVGVEDDVVLLVLADRDAVAVELDVPTPAQRPDLQLGAARRERRTPRVPAMS